MAEKDNNEIEGLMLEAKKAILEEQHRRFQELQARKMWPEAMKQLQVTLACASDLLKDSVTLLEKAEDRRKSELGLANEQPSPEEDAPT